VEKKEKSKKTKSVKTKETPKKDKEIVISKKEKKAKRKIYLSYGIRITISIIIIIFLSLTGLFCTSKTLDIEKAKIIKYKETGNLDYKVYLKENNFYEQSYLGKGIVYIANLIKNINVDVNYDFVIEEKADINISYEIIGKLSITGGNGKNKLYEKEYVLKRMAQEFLPQYNMYNIKDNIVIDYDYYNTLANSFKSTYGLGDASSNLIIYVKLNKAVKNDSQNININESKQMSLTIPLTQKTLEISINDTGITGDKSIVKESRVTSANIVFGVLSVVSFIIVVFVIIKLLKLLSVLSPKTTKYDKYIKKVLREYDRLIVETPTEPKYEETDVIKINRFEELLDARDNLKRPIMYHNLVSHQKCHFYIENGNTMYLLTIKATDLENNNKK